MLITANNGSIQMQQYLDDLFDPLETTTFPVFPENKGREREG